jgi:hypothetical protein
MRGDFGRELRFWGIVSNYWVKSKRKPFKNRKLD